MEVGRCQPCGEGLSTPSRRCRQPGRGSLSRPASTFAASSTTLSSTTRSCSASSSPGSAPAEWCWARTTRTGWGRWTLSALSARLGSSPQTSKPSSAPAPARLSPSREPSLNPGRGGMGGSMRSAWRRSCPGEIDGHASPYPFRNTGHAAWTWPIWCSSLRPAAASRSRPTFAVLQLAPQVKNHEQKKSCTDHRWTLLTNRPPPESCHHCSPMNESTTPLATTQTRDADRDDSKHVQPRAHVVGLAVRQQVFSGQPPLDRFAYAQRPAHRPRDVSSLGQLRIVGIAPVGEWDHERKCEQHDHDADHDQVRH